MADSVAITAGLGTEIATDRVAGQHYQLVKLVDSTEDSTTRINPLSDSELRAAPVQVAFGDTQDLDAFGRLRVSNPHNQLEFHHQWDLAPLFAGTTSDTTGTVTHVPPAARLTADAGETVKHQSHYYATYQPGKGRKVRMTGVFGAHVSGADYLMGYGDDNDGVFIRRKPSGVMAILLRSSTIADVDVEQSSWNIDPMDGTGPSGLTLTNTVGLHGVIDLEWLSIGRVRWGFGIGGTIVYVHAFDGSNNQSVNTSYMRTGSLPLRWELVNGGASTATLDAVCATAVSEGGHDPSGLLWSADTGATPITIPAATLQPLLSVRPRATFNSITNRGVLIPGAITAIADDNCMIEVYIAGTVTGSWTKVDTTTSPAADGNSHAEYVVAPTLSGGRKIASFPVAGASGSTYGLGSGVIGNDLLQFLASDGYQLPVTICARKLGSGTSAAVVSMQWVEIR